LPPDGVLDLTPTLRRLAARRLAALDCMDPAGAQALQLRALLRRASRTRFGRAHGFAAIDSVAAFQACIPVRGYEAFWREWWQPAYPVLRDVTWPGRIPYFAYSSGTTGDTTKRIPVSRAMLRANRRAALLTLYFHLANRPDSRVLAGTSFLLGGSTALERLAPGVHGGDLSGIAAVEVPRWARPRTFPPPDLALIPQWDRKIAALVPASLREDVRSLSGTPSWMLPFFDRLAAAHPDRPRRLAAFFPDLELLVHGGVAFAPYRDLFAQWLAGGHAETREVYAASEGFIAVADRGPDQGMRLLLDNGLFYEFVPADRADDPEAPRHWIANAETGVNYALIVSSNAGLWAYRLGDTVTLLTLDPPRLLITGRTAYMLSAFGEHLIGREIDDAIAEAAAASATGVADYAVGVIYPHPGEPRGGHLFIVEPAGGTADPAAFAATLDAALKRQNEDYTAHRAGDVAMLPPRVHFAASGTFAEWMRRRGRLGGQNKVPRIINDAMLFADLRGFAGESVVKAGKEE